MDHGPEEDYDGPVKAFPEETWLRHGDSDTEEDTKARGGLRPYNQTVTEAWL